MILTKEYIESLDKKVYQDVDTCLEHFTNLELEKDETFWSQYSKDNPLYYHVYWYGKISEKQYACILSYLQTQGWDNTKLIVWIDHENPENLRDEVSIMQKYNTFKLYKPEELAKGTPFEGHDFININNPEYIKYRSDFARIMILYHYGGVYFDLDMILLKDLSPLLHMEFCYQWSNIDGRGNNALLSLYKGSDMCVKLMNKYIDQVVNKSKPLSLDFNRVIFDKELGLLQLPCALFDPCWILLDTNTKSKYSKLLDFDGFFKTTNEKLRLKNGTIDMFSGNIFAYHWHSRNDYNIEKDSYFKQIHSLIYTIQRRRSYTFLIYGAKGWIGSMFYDYCVKEKIRCVKGKARIDNLNDLSKEIDDVKPTHVISFTGRTYGEIDGVKYNTIDYLEQKGKLYENIRDNLYGPLNLVMACNEKAHLTYMGTGCIFNSSYENGYEKQPTNKYDENSEPDFFGSSYSIVKGFTDKLMHTLPDKLYKEPCGCEDYCYEPYYNGVLNLRIRMPITSNDEPRNFISKILRYEKICSIQNSMTVLDDYIPIIFDMIVNCKKGTYNCTNPGTISHNEILSLYKEHVDPNFEWKNFTVKEQNEILASERSNNMLDTTLIKSEHPNLKPIKESVIGILKNWQPSQ